MFQTGKICKYLTFLIVFHPQENKALTVNRGSYDELPEEVEKSTKNILVHGIRAVY